MSNINDLNKTLENVIECIQEKDVNAFMGQLDATLRKKYTVKSIEKTHFYTDGSILQALMRLKSGKWFVEEDKALLTSNVFRLALLMKKEGETWKFSGFVTKKLDIPEVSKGYHIDAVSLKSYPQEVQEKIHDIMAFHKEVCEVICSQNIEAMQKIFTSFKTRRPYRFQRIPIINYYLANSGRETSRSIKCIRLSGTEATIDFDEVPLVWYLIKLTGCWCVARIIDFSTADFKPSELPIFYFKNKENIKSFIER